MKSDRISGQIILVEDNEEVSEIMCHFLEDISKNIKVVRFSNGKDALAYLTQYYDSVSGVISDLMMSEMDGIDFLATLRKDSRTASLPFLFLSGADPTVFSNLLKGYQFSGFIAKPVHPVNLKDLIQSHFRTIRSTSLSA
ncbi:MAG: response regulator [Pseudobdellovibrionaceae bacterium]